MHRASNDLRAAEIALAAVRNRLRILGKSDAEIDALETRRQDERRSPWSWRRSAARSSQRQVGLGQYINSAAAAPPIRIFSIGDLSTVWLVANVRETDAPRDASSATPVEVHVLAYPERVFKAKLTYVAPVGRSQHASPAGAGRDRESRRRAEAGDVRQFQHHHRRRRRGARRCRRSAVVYEGDDGAGLGRAATTARWRCAPIRVGRTSDGMVEVLAGLKPARQVVTSGSLFIDRAAKGD